MASADELLKRYVMDHYSDRGKNLHKTECGEVKVQYTAEDGKYGCDTGCDYVRFEAVLSCPHERDEIYQFGDFGELCDIIEGMGERDEGTGSRG